MFAFIAKHQGIWPISWMCVALAVSRSGFHAWLTRRLSARTRGDVVFNDRVRASFLLSDRTYGARRVWRDILEEGFVSGLHRIERLMRLHGLRARPRRRQRSKDAGTRSVIAPNVLERDFAADRPNRKWVADFTYIWTAEGWLYLAVVLDLFARRVVGRSMKNAMTADLVTNALVMAIWRRGTSNEPMHHFDQGSQYTRKPFLRRMADHGITCSMSRSGFVWDNAAMEIFFSSMKTERTAHRLSSTRDQARADTIDYIERFYNPGSVIRSWVTRPNQTQGATIESSISRPPYRQKVGGLNWRAMPEPSRPGLLPDHR